MWGVIHQGENAIGCRRQDSQTHQVPFRGSCHTGSPSSACTAAHWLRLGRSLPGQRPLIPAYTNDRKNRSIHAPPPAKLTRHALHAIFLPCLACFLPVPANSCSSPSGNRRHCGPHDRSTVPMLQRMTPSQTPPYVPARTLCVSDGSITRSAIGR